MDPGRLDRLMRLQSPSETPDSAGQLPGTYTTVGTLYARVLMRSGIEQATAAGEASIGRCSVRIYRRSGVTAKMRLLDGATAYNILFVPPVSADPVYMDLPCEVVNAVS